MAATATTSSATGARSIGGERLKETLVGYGFIAGPMLVYGLLFFYPIAYSIYISRYDWGALGKISSRGSGNYRDLLHDHRFGLAVKNGLKFTIGFAVFSMALGLFVAVVVNNAVRARTFFRSAYYFPSIASSAAITAIALFVLSADGIFNKLTGLHHAWFGESGTALWAIVGLNSWTTSGTVMLFYLAYLQAIPTEVYEAAAIDGANWWSGFWRITFPLLQPAHFFVAVVSFIGALQVFDQAFVAGGASGAPANSLTTMVLYLYQQFGQKFEFGYAAAVGIVLFVVIMAFTLIQRRLFGQAPAW